MGGGNTNIHSITLSFKLFPPRSNWSDPFIMQGRSYHPPFKSFRGLSISVKVKAKERTVTPKALLYLTLWLLLQPHLLNCPPPQFTFTSSALCLLQTIQALSCLRAFASDALSARNTLSLEGSKAYPRPRLSFLSCHLLSKTFSSLYLKEN